MTRSARTCPLLLAALTLGPAASPAQGAGTVLPKQMRIIVASVGGTGTDFIARLIAPRLGDGSRQSVIEWR